MFGRARKQRNERSELSRRERRFTRLRSGFGVPRYELIAVSQLNGHVLARLQSLEAATEEQNGTDTNEDPDRLQLLEGTGNPVVEGNSAATGTESDRLKDWVASRFTYPLRALLLQANRDSQRLLILSVTVIGGGFATSGIAIAGGSGTKHTGSSVSWVVFAIGLLVALAGGVNQLTRPGYRASERRTLAVELEEEGWAFANKTGAYVKDERKTFEDFDRRISTILRRAAQVTSVDTGSTRRRSATH